jgi:bifunctional DNA-binding transcriptional regulator/antitoxin component of YhaV-PrlF toxin-antitoxin module
MCTQVVSHAGKKGELYPPKSLREAVGIHPGTTVVFRLVGEKLEVQAIPSLKDVLGMGPIAEVTLDELDKSRSELLGSLVKRK